MGHKPNTEKSSQTGPSAKQTPEELIHELRMNVKALLFVPKHQIEALLEKADLDNALMIQNTNLLLGASETIKELEARVAELKLVNSELLLKLENLQETRVEDIIRVASVAQDEKGLY